MAQEVPRISREELKEKMDDPQVEILDVRKKKDVGESEEKIQGATWKDPNEVGNWMKQYPTDKTYILY